MNLLLVNDDGIDAEGIHRLAETLGREEGVKIYVCAPNEQQSATSQSISVRGRLRVLQEEFEEAEEAISVTGTPADCVKIAMAHYGAKGIDIDMVFSGINHGGNLGTDTLYSGTVGAALEGSLCGIPSVAVSVNSHEPQYFEYTCDLIKKVFYLAAEKLRESIVLNVNVPHMPAEKVRGLKITKLGMREYEDWFVPMEDEEGEVYRYEGRPIEYDSDDLSIDVIAAQHGYATITPLSRFLTDREAMVEIAAWDIEDADSMKIRRERNDKENKKRRGRGHRNRFSGKAAASNE